MAGRVSDLKCKAAESIVYRHDREWLGSVCRTSFGFSTRGHRPLLRVSAGQVGRAIGAPDGAIVFDPSGFATKGQASAGVQGQWLGRIGKVDNARAASSGPTPRTMSTPWSMFRLYLPKAWAKDRARRRRCGIPKAVRYRTRHELAWEMLRETGPLWPRAWITGEGEMRRSSRSRAELRRSNERYLLAVPSNTTIRDLEREAPEGSGRGPHPKRAFEQDRTWSGSLPSGEWRRPRSAMASGVRSSWSWPRRGSWRGRTGGGSGRRSCWW
ncbi:MAG: hypothetical protein JWN86_4400 [Planctomycetota bacterium]|nr:hypothetical protein [Planctomycetota bacterium]